MSVNCISCGSARRDGIDLYCTPCRVKKAVARLGQSDRGVCVLANLRQFLSGDYASADGENKQAVRTLMAAHESAPMTVCDAIDAELAGERG